MAVLDGKFYTVGGEGADADYSNSVERYDLTTKSWEAVAPMATARGSSSATVLGGKLYAMGGGAAWNDIGRLSSVERYDPALDAWEAVAPMATAREQFGAAVLDGKIYVVAGCNSDHVDPLSSVERYDPAVNEWEEVAPVATARDRLGAAVLCGVRAHGRLTFCGRWFVANGPFNPFPTPVERYDQRTNACEAVAPTRPYCKPVCSGAGAAGSLVASISASPPSAITPTTTALYTILSCDA